MAQKKQTKKTTKPKPWLIREIKNSDLPKVYELLSEKFPDNAIVKGELWYGLETEGPRGQSVINRLNEVLGINHWHYEYELEDEKRTSKSGTTIWSSTCGMKLMIGNWNTVRVGISTPDTVNKIESKTDKTIFIPLVSRSWVGGVSHMSRSEAKKGSITNTLKKCATALGVANEVYERLSEPEFENKEQSPSPQYKEGENKPSQKSKKQPNRNVKVDKKGDVYSQLLTDLNSVKDKETYVKAKEMMDEVKDKLTSTQLQEAIKIFANLKEKYQ